MANGTTGAGTAGLGAAGLVLLVALGACNPVATWRNVTGVSKNDPNPATTPNTKNLAAGAAAPYPNLATVPPPPTRELTQAELGRLTQSLIADRTNARYTDQELRAGPAAAAPTPVQPAPAAGPAATGVTLAAAPAVPATPTPAAKAPPPIVQAAAAAYPAAPPASPAASGAAAAKTSETATKTAATEAPSNSLNGMASGLRKPGQPAGPGPMESALVPPQIRETPQPEPPQPPPAPPRLVAVPTAKGGAAAPPPPPAPPSTGATAFQAPPPPPVLVPPAPTAAATAKPAGERPAATGKPVAEITFAAGSKSLSGGDVETLQRVAALYREHPGKLRVIGSVWVVGAADPLTTFSTALDQAQAVAAALAKTGVPAAKIAAEASPAKDAAAADHVEVLLEPPGPSP
jgi:outer membrane protein OmpA-like peptidoglycan-associated protein